MYVVSLQVLSSCSGLARQLKDPRMKSAAVHQLLVLVVIAVIHGTSGNAVHHKHFLHERPLNSRVQCMADLEGVAWVPWENDVLMSLQCNLVRQLKDPRMRSVAVGYLTFLVVVAVIHGASGTHYHRLLYPTNLSYCGLASYRNQAIKLWFSAYFYTR